MKKVIIISAHPDDETLGAGGALLRHKANGDKVYWLIVTNVFEHQGFSKERINFFIGTSPFNKESIHFSASLRPS